ncbi:oleosin G-like [Mangifera indica]|uniref:oleosin G-like n=1 Tax=Mangifera indica TaxID=29780 RepID=UPI001CFB5594|nr:oleosin G-like [Mangifera indica]
MAERNPNHQRPSRPNPPLNANSFLLKFQAHAPNSAQLIGFLTLFISGSILLLLTGLTVAATVLGLILFAPLLIISSPIWVPIGTFLFLTVAGFLSICGFGVAIVAGLSWMYRYFRGLHPPGSDRVDYARSRIYDTASHVKDYAREYGGYLQGKVKDAAPGA